MRMAAAALPLSTARPTLDFGCAISEIRLPSAIIGVYAKCEALRSVSRLQILRFKIYTKCSKLRLPAIHHLRAVNCLQPVVYGCHSGNL
jgi:hypothetical protein